MVWLGVCVLRTYGEMKTKTNEECCLSCLLYSINLLVLPFLIQFKISLNKHLNRSYIHTIINKRLFRVWKFR